MKVPEQFAKAISHASEISGVSISDIFEEALLMTPDGYILREVAGTSEIANIPPALLPILDDMALSFGFTRDGLLLEMAKYVHKAAAARIAHDEEKARYVRRQRNGV
ncbi:MAG: hypothetical protein VW405_19450 [Rhodospirillaceae bacterium]